MVDKPPRWNDTPPPGFTSDGTSLIVPAGETVEYPPVKIEVDGKEYSTEEYDALLAQGLADDDKGIEDDDDLSDLDELDDLADL